MNVFWFRRDLRIDDNRGFFEALNCNNKVLPIFIFDKNILETIENQDARVNYIYDSLERINAEFKKIGKSLAVFYGDPIIILEQLIQENQIESVFTNHDYEPYAQKRDMLFLLPFLKNGRNILLKRASISLSLKAY